MPCPGCGFSGPPEAAEELAHVRYLLAELDQWPSEVPGLSPVAVARLRDRYTRRQRELEIALGLRPPPPTPEEARELARQLTRLETTLDFLRRWGPPEWRRPETAPTHIGELEREIAARRARLSEAETPPPSPQGPQPRLDILRSVRDEIHHLVETGVWTDEARAQRALAELEKSIAELETLLGLRPAPEIRKGRRAVPAGTAATAPAATAPPPAPPPRPPLTWDLVWRTLLSERTLRAFLFIGAFLVFASAVTLVVYNWERFSPWAQVAILSAFTLFFYGLGWYVRGPMRLRHSGIALTATASLLVPVDFYAVYLSGGIFPKEAWAEVWWLASAVCLVAYSLTVWAVRAEFFGYLVGTALGSLLCASLQLAGVSSDLWSPCLSALALALLVAEPRGPAVLRRPFRHLALLTTLTGALLLTGLWLAGQGDRSPFRLALALDWWLVAATYGLTTARTLQPMFLSVACAALPMASYTSLAPLFERAGVPSAWHTLPLAALSLIYETVGFTARRADRTRALTSPLVGWAIGLAVLSAAWGLTDMAAAAAAHAVLAAAAALAARLWGQPRLLSLASLLSLSAALTGASTLGLELAEYGLPPASLALTHLVAAVLLRRAQRYTPYLYAGALALAALALFPPLVAEDRPWFIYTLGHAIALSGWTAALAHTGAHPGLNRLFPRRSVLHWTTALPLPLWFGLFWHDYIRPTDAWQGLAMTALAALLLWVTPRLGRRDPTYGLPWHATSVLAAVTGVVLSLFHYDRLPVALNLLAVSALTLAYAVCLRQRGWLAVGGLVFPFGYGLTLDHLRFPPDALATALTVPSALYLLVGTYLEHRRGVGRPFLLPLYGAAHPVAFATFLGLWARVAEAPDSDPTLLWAAGGHLILALAYGTTAWYWGLRERAAITVGVRDLAVSQVESFHSHVAAWLGVGAGGLIAAAYSQGRGSSAAKAALLAIAYVLAERVLFALRDRRPTAGRAWSLYRSPLLVAGWAVSAGAIFLALVRNFLILGGGPVRENWSIVALLMIVALYAASAWAFRRPLFLWLACPLLVAPWTLLTHRGWYIWEPSPVPRYALGWVVLAYLLEAVGLLLAFRSSAWRPYGTPPQVTAHLLLPIALLWGAGNPQTSSVTFGLAVGFYGLAALADHLRGRRGPAAARFLYPASFLLPVWGLYLLARFRPGLPQTHFGVLLLLFAPVLFALARLLRRVHPADALPAYLAAYASAIAGTAVVSSDRPLLVLALLLDTGLALVSAVVLREPAWGYPAAAFPAGALLLALAERGFPTDWRGLWLVGLGAVYLTIAWALRRLPVRRYAVPPTVVAYTVIALGLPIAGYDPLAAGWTFGTAAVLYGLSAFWLREPLFLSPAMGLAPVPYIVVLERTRWLAPADWGLALWPGILLAGALGRYLEGRFGDWPPFPWESPARWPSEAARRLVGWWPLAPYLVAGLGTVTAVSWSWDFPLRRVLAFLLATVACGWALSRFRRRGWLVALLVAAQGAWWSGVDGAAQGLVPLSARWSARLAEPAWQAWAFLPATLLTALAGLAVQRRWGEGPPFGDRRTAWRGWSRPFFWLLMVDMVAVQVVGVRDPHPGTLISSAHAALLAALALVWSRPFLAYGAVTLGAFAVLERLLWAAAPLTDFPRALALLATAYGVAGYWMEYGRRGREGRRFWDVLEEPLEVGGQILAATSIAWALAEGLEVWRWLARALLGFPTPTGQDIVIVQMVVLVLALTGLMYLTAALVRRWCWRGYGAVAMLLLAWSLEWFLVWGLREVQWYAVPAGLYLLGVGYGEWRQGRKALGRWIDRAAVLLLLGSSFYQSVAEVNGWPYALVMGAEGLLLVWWGSARRQRQFLYTGTLGVVLAVTGQLVRQLFTVTNAWIAFGVPGLVILALVIWIERRLEYLRAVSEEWRERLEEWE